LVDDQATAATHPIRKVGIWEFNSVVQAKRLLVFEGADRPARNRVPRASRPKYMNICSSSHIHLSYLFFQAVASSSSQSREIRNQSPPPRSRGRGGGDAGHTRGHPLWTTAAGPAGAAAMASRRAARGEGGGREGGSGRGKEEEGGNQAGAREAGGLEGGRESHVSEAAAP